MTFNPVPVGSGSVAPTLPTNVSDSTRQTIVPVLGSLVFWNLSTSSRQRFHTELTALNLEKYLPKAPSNYARLRDAITASAKVRSKQSPPYLFYMAVQPKSKNKPFELISVDQSVQPNEYKLIYSVLTPPDGNGFLSLKDGLSPLFGEEANLQRIYTNLANTCSASAMGLALTKICFDTLDAIALKSSGGLYWISERHKARWHDIADATLAASHVNKLYTLAVCKNVDSLIAVQDALTAEVDRELKKLSEDINDETGTRSLKNKQQHAIDMKHKIAAYEKVIGRPMNHLHQACDTVKTAAAEAVLARMDN